MSDIVFLLDNEGHTRVGLKMSGRAVEVSKLPDLYRRQMQRRLSAIDRDPESPTVCGQNRQIVAMRPD
ncbi:MAG TPA: hypothetical protein VN872_13695 [Candidatus Acidoferrum sp.]|nr:hypothetical protein [Candidatus Acidoferrum sp.]